MLTFTLLLVLTLILLFDNTASYCYISVVFVVHNIQVIPETRYSWFSLTSYPGL